MNLMEPEEIVEFERIRSTGQPRQYITCDGMPWLELFRNDIRSGAFVGQDNLDVRYPSINPSNFRSRF